MKVFMRDRYERSLPVRDQLGGLHVARARKEWPSLALYHLTINSTVGDDGVVRTLPDEMATLSHAKSESG